MLSKALATLSLLFGPALAAPQAAKWRFDLLKNNSGIVALESIVVSPSLAIFFDRATGDQPLKTSDGKGAHGALWDISTGTVRPLDVKTDSFCASGALLSNGSMVSVGGHPGATTSPVDIAEAGGPNALRIFEPCASPSGEGCTLFEDVNTLHLLAPRWYPSSVRIFDGSLMIVGGMHTRTIFYNTEPENSFEFFPRKEQTVRPSAFLERSLPANLFPRAFALPDGKVFLVANNQSIIYDIEANTERILPDIPNGVRVTNPLDGSAILLPLSPPDYTPEVLVCGGTVLDTNIPVEQLSSQHPATAQCSRITLTEAGIARGWEVEQMLEPRIMPELLHVPNGQILITNGGRTGFVGFSAVRDPVGNSNADHPAFTPALYTPSAPLGRRFSNAGMPTTNIARLYHSSVTLTDAGNFLVAGSNPNGNFTAPLPGVKFPSELRVEMLNPPFMFVPRPVVGDAPKNLAFGQKFTVPVSVPSGLNADKVQVALMDLGFSSHAFHSSARLVFMEAQLSRDRRSLTFTTPPNGRVFPPGPAIIFLTIDDVTAEGVRVMMGSGASPPTLE